MRLLAHAGTDIYSRGISLWTRTRVTHCEVEFNDGLRFAALPGVGCTFRPPIIPGTPRWRRSIPLVGDDDAVRSFCKSINGARYDWSGILLSQVVNIHRDSRSRWFCSELAYVALIKSGFFGYGPHKEPAQVSPGRLLKILGQSWESLTPV